MRKEAWESNVKLLASGLRGGCAECLLTQKVEEREIEQRGRECSYKQATLLLIPRALRTYPLPIDEDRAQRPDRLLKAQAPNTGSLGE